VDFGFVHQAFALQDTEAVLLVDGRETEARKFDVVLDQGVGANDELRNSGTNAIKGGGFLRRFQPANEQFYAIASGLEDAAGRKKVLHGKNFRGGHQRGLTCVFHSDHCCLKSDDGFSAAHVALQEATHGDRLLQVSHDFGKNPLLRGSGLKGKNASEGLADGIFAESEGDGVLLTGGLTIEREAELVKEEFVEDEPALRRGAVGVECVNGLLRRRKMGVDQSLLPSWKLEAGAELVGQDIRAAEIEELQRSMDGAANGPGTEGADGLIDRDDAADFGRVGAVLPNRFHLRIDHFQACGTLLVNFHLPMKD